MGWFDRFARKPKDSGERINSGRLTATISNVWGALSPYRSKTKNVLETLRSIDDETDALRFLRKVNPDVSMAVWNFIRLSNQGHQMTFESLDGRRLQRVEKKWERFASRINAISNAGLDGLIDQLHYSAFMEGAQGAEVEVARTLDDIVDVYPVKPQSIEWEWDKEKQRWVAFQQQAMKRVSLEGANFYWVPTDPDIDDPRGNLIMGSVLQAIDFQMQVLSDLQAVIHNQGWPRYDIKLLSEKLYATMPAKVKGDPKAQRAWIQERFADVEKWLGGLKPDDSFIHMDDTEIGKTQGGEVTRSVDVRAIAEMLDVQTMGGMKQMGILVNRNVGITESHGSVQFRIFVSGIISIQRGSKRLLEEIARLWLRTQGIQAVPKFTHNVLDWETEEQKQNVALLKQKFHAIAQLMGWQSGDDASAAVLGSDKAAGEPVEGTRVSFNGGGVTLGRDDGASGRVDAPAREVGGSADGAQARLRVFGGKGVRDGRGD